MRTDINQIYLQSGKFATLVKEEHPIKNLEDGVIYVKASNDEIWIRAIEEAKRSFATSRVRGMWLMKYDVDVLPEYVSFAEDSNIGRFIRNGYNLIMPIFIPHESGQYFLVGKFPEYKYLRLASAWLTVDAQNLLEASIPHALSAFDTDELESIVQGICDGCITDAWGDTVRELNKKMYSRVSFKGKPKVNPMAALGDAAAAASDSVKRGELSYKEQRSKIMDLPKIAKKMREDDEAVQDKAMANFGAAWAALSHHEQVLLVQEMMKAIKPKALKGIVASTADREELGAKTKYKVVVSSWKSEYKKFGFDDNYKMCLFIKRPSSESGLKEQLYPLKMPKNAAVIYTMSLIEKVTKNGKYAVVDVKKNNKAFVEIYRCMFHSNTDSIQKGYEELFFRNNAYPNSSLRSGRLSESYNDIERALSDVFKNLDEDYSPFLMKKETPLALISEKIELPEELEKIKIH